MFLLLFEKMCKLFKINTFQNAKYLLLVLVVMFQIFFVSKTHLLNNKTSFVLVHLYFASYFDLFSKHEAVTLGKKVLKNKSDASGGLYFNNMIRCLCQVPLFCTDVT